MWHGDVAAVWAVGVQGGTRAGRTPGEQRLALSPTQLEHTLQTTNPSSYRDVPTLCENITQVPLETGNLFVSPNLIEIYLFYGLAIGQQIQ